MENKRIEKLEKENKELKDFVNNHITDNTKAMGIVNTELATVKTDVSWLKKNYWIVASASVGAVVAAVANLLK